MTSPVRSNRAKTTTRRLAPAALAGAGAIRSTAADMLTYLEAQLHPDKLAGHLKAGANSRTLPAAIMRSQAVQADAAPIGKIAFNWLRNDQSGDYLHDGATAGFSSFAFFNPKEDFGALVLVNTGPETQPFATLVGVHIRQRFTGAPAISPSTSSSCRSIRS